MNVLEIILLIIGLIVFVVSFKIPEKGEKLEQKDLIVAEETIKQMVEQEMKRLRDQMEEIAEETVTYATEKAERTLERISNEKIMAVNEYSDTVLDTIHKCHEEVVFLYDMLNQKQQSLKNAVLEAQKIVKAVELKSKAVKEDMQSCLINQKKELSQSKSDIQEKINLLEEKSSELLAKTKEETKQKAAQAELHPEDVISEAVPFSQAIVNNQNSNEKILQMKKDGKSKMQIAKELGLGVGEVKLVIDLFEGM